MSNNKSIISKLKDEPLVPLGVGATIAAFLYACHGMHRGNQMQTQWGMRGRVLMQGLTVAALLGYGIYKSTSGGKHQTERILHARPINWEKLEREAKEAEQPRDSDTATNVFAKEKD